MVSRLVVVFRSENCFRRSYTISNLKVVYWFGGTNYCAISSLGFWSGVKVLASTREHINHLVANHLQVRWWFSFLPFVDDFHCSQLWFHLLWHSLHKRGRRPQPQATLSQLRPTRRQWRWQGPAWRWQTSQVVNKLASVQWVLIFMNYLQAWRLGSGRPAGTQISSNSKCVLRRTQHVN